MSKIFVDTNVLVYAFQSAHKKLQKLSRDRLKTLENDDQGVISTQVIQEFFVVATRKMGVDPIQAKKVIREFDNLCTITSARHKRDIESYFGLFSFNIIISNKSGKLFSPMDVHVDNLCKRE